MNKVTYLQKMAWRLHKMECPHLKKVHPNIPTDSVRLLTQIIFKLKVTENKTFISLWSHGPYDSMVYLYTARF